MQTQPQELPAVWVAFATDASESHKFCFSYEMAQAICEQHGWDMAPLYRPPYISNTEKQALQSAIIAYELDDDDPECAEIAAALQSLLDRLSKYR